MDQINLQSDVESTRAAKLRVQKWPDNSGNDDHGREGGGSEPTDGDLDVLAEKADKASDRAYGLLNSSASNEKVGRANLRAEKAHMRHAAVARKLQADADAEESEARAKEHFRAAEQYGVYQKSAAVSSNLQFEIVRKDAAKRRIYGWFSVAKTKDGKTLVDRHGDVIDVAELESAASEFLKEYRQGGLEHAGGAPNELISSVVFSRELQDAMGIPAGVLPEGWFGGFEVAESVYQRVAKGSLLMFSIEGEAEPESEELADTEVERTK